MLHIHQYILTISSQVRRSQWPQLSHTDNPLTYLLWILDGAPFLPSSLTLYTLLSTTHVANRSCRLQWRCLRASQRYQFSLHINNLSQLTRLKVEAVLTVSGPRQTRGHATVWKEKLIQSEIIMSSGRWKWLADIGKQHFKLFKKSFRNVKLLHWNIRHICQAFVQIHFAPATARSTIFLHLWFFSSKFCLYLFDWLFI